ncbi:MAG: hypothetical protein KDB04_18500 [Acidimicrobiales bacterium]|nr:hypothetical protein [Acidimicrobiales bacterium]HRW36761.1 hypothetical protein [Aquihabitans sp.]
MSSTGSVDGITKVVETTTPTSYPPTVLVQRVLGTPDTYVPGNTNQVRDLARRSNHLADDLIADAQEVLRTVDAVLADSARWSGAFHRGFTTVGPLFGRLIIDDLAPQLRSASDALQRYAERIDALKQEAARRIKEGEGAELRRLRFAKHAEDLRRRPGRTPEMAHDIEQLVTEANEPNRQVTAAQQQLENVRRRRLDTDRSLATSLSDVKDRVHAVTMRASEVSTVAGGPGGPDIGDGGGPGGPSADPVGSTAPAPSIPTPTDPAGGGGGPSVGRVPATTIGGSGAGSPGDVAGPGDPMFPVASPGSGADGGAGSGGLGAATTIGLGAGGAALLAGGGAAVYGRLRSGGGEVLASAAPGGASSTSATGTTADDPGAGPATAGSRRRNAPRTVVAAGADGVGRRSGPAEIDWGTVVPIVGAAAGAAAGMVIVGERMGRSGTTAGFGDRWLDLGRRALGRRTLDEVERRSVAAAAGRSEADGGTPRYPTVAQLPGGLEADVPGGWTVAHGDDCVVIAPGHRGGSFAGNIVVYEDPSAASELLAGIDDLPGNVTVERGATSARLRGERVRFGYALDRSPLTVHRHLVRGVDDVLVVATATVATDRIGVEGAVLDAVLGSLRVAA